jgi:hypothetical protein
LSDVARVQVGVLDEDKVKGNRNFILDAGRTSFEEDGDFVRYRLPEAVEKGIFPLGGTVPSSGIRFDARETKMLFGPLISYKENVVNVAKRYIELSSSA